MWPSFSDPDLYCQYECSACPGSQVFLLCLFHRINVLVYSPPMLPPSQISTLRVILVCLFACYSQYCKCQFKLEWARLWGRGPLWHLEHFSGTGGRRGELWNHCPEKLLWETGLPQRNWVKAFGNCLYQSMAGFHTAKPPHIWQGHSKETSGRITEPLHSTQECWLPAPGCCPGTSRQGPPEVAGLAES